MSKQYKMLIKTKAVKQAIKTGMVKLNWVTLKDLRRLQDAGFTVVIKGDKP